MIIEYRETSKPETLLLKIEPNNKGLLALPNKDDDVIIDNKTYRVHKKVFDYEYMERQMGRNVKVLLVTIIVDDLSL